MAAVKLSRIYDLTGRLSWISNSRLSAAGFAPCCRPSVSFLRPSVSTSLTYVSSSSPRAHVSPLPRSSSSERRLITAPALGATAQTLELGTEDEEDGEETEREVEVERDVVDQQEIVPTRPGFPPLGNHEKKELRAYAHGLGTRLNVQQVGKLGVSQTVVTSISDALEANEILKVKVLENCASSMGEIIMQLEQGTGGQVVGKIGRTVLLYRASLRKLTASEKRPKKLKRRSR